MLDLETLDRCAYYFGTFEQALNEAPIQDLQNLVDQPEAFSSLPKIRDRIKFMLHCKKEYEKLGLDLEYQLSLAMFEE